MDNEDILKRILGKLDTTCENVQHMMVELALVKKTVHDHLTEIDVIRDKKDRKKDRQNKIIFSLIGVLFGAYAIFKELF